MQNDETAPAGRRRVDPVRGPALGYQRSRLTGHENLPDGWREVSASATLGEGVDLFDRVTDDLLDFSAHDRAGVGVVQTTRESPTDVMVTGGPMRGPCRLVDRIDESLRQGLVVGTLAGNRAVAEHRCHLDLDPRSGCVAVTVRTVFRPRDVSVLPGAAGREAAAHQRMVDRVVRALCVTGSDLRGR